jgi:hypothetical protein
MMKKYRVYGRVRADIQFEEIVEASNDDAAENKALNIVRKRCGIGKYDELDHEIYLEKV